MNDYYNDVAITKDRREHHLQEAERERLVAANRLSTNGGIIKSLSSAIGNLMIAAGERLARHNDGGDELQSMTVHRA